MKYLGVPAHIQIKRQLVKRGAKVEVAENGLVGYEKASSSKFDVVLMDIQMPVMDGYTATKKLRSSGFQKPIIAISAHAMNDAKSQSLASGCDNYLTKPIDFNELTKMISEGFNKIYK